MATDPGILALLMQLLRGGEEPDPMMGMLQAEGFPTEAGEQLADLIRPQPQREIISQAAKDQERIEPEATPDITSETEDTYKEAGYSPQETPEHRTPEGWPVDIRPPGLFSDSPPVEAEDTSAKDFMMALSAIQSPERRMPNLQAPAAPARPQGQTGQLLQALQMLGINPLVFPKIGG